MYDRETFHLPWTITSARVISISEICTKGTYEAKTPSPLQSSNQKEVLPFPNLNEKPSRSTSLALSTFFFQKEDEFVLAGIYKIELFPKYLWDKTLTHNFSNFCTKTHTNFLNKEVFPCVTSWIPAPPCCFKRTNMSHLRRRQP